ncbi:uncharacterized protein B0I36DRAFT_356650 [Microdochium trichocladiopsis]|uniref:Uncharacterized protein n=1 Tax=Microdochium trichocladiopsis TaxID=1682393 RepID=A0A9P8XSM5_9PEZI|nr:uncharacterized protein B0I36DRAFT_356650 [Microdochium trichocladiopsis]KAH7009416.1 hypothetical protein B0I36DRAFT_356650 [Microdochium trichocladiopsis]
MAGDSMGCWSLSTRLDEPDAVAGLGCGPVATEASVECATRDSVMTTSIVASVFDHGFEQDFACCLGSAETCRVWCCPRGFACRIDICGRAGGRRADSRCAVGRKRIMPAWETTHQTTTLALFLGCDVRCDVVSFADRSSVRCDERSDADPFRWDSCAYVSTFTRHGVSGQHDPSHSAQATERALEIIALHGGHARGTLPARPVKAISEIESGSLQSHGPPTWGAGPKVETLPD